METIQANRLPLITYRYLKSNDSPLLFKAPSRLAKVVFSDTAYVRAGGIWPSDYNETAPEVTSASGQGKTYTIEIPGETVPFRLKVLPCRKELLYRRENTFYARKRQKSRNPVPVH